MGYFSRLDAEHCTVPASAENEAPPFGNDFPEDATPSLQPESTIQSEIPASLPQATIATPAAPSADTQAQESSKEDEDAKRKAHEAEEAKRKAEWEAKQKAKKDAEQAKIDQIAAMSDQEVMAAAMKQVSADTEKLTRRNMKDCVSEYIQALCVSNPAFARMAMQPRKSMIHCFQYINRMAWDYIQDELKASGIQPSQTQPYSCDVPDDLCYQWAEDYFRDPNAKEDEEKEEQFVPKPYAGSSRPKSKAKEKKSAVKKEPAKKPPEPKPSISDQITLGDLGLLEKAG